MTTPKKTTVKKPEVKATKPEPQLPPQIIEENTVNVALSQADLETFINLMTVCSQTFEALALQAAQEKDMASFDVLSARHKLSFVFANKLAEFNSVGEPTSRDLH